MNGCLIGSCLLRTPQAASTATKLTESDLTEDDGICPKSAFQMEFIRTGRESVSRHAPPTVTFRPPAPPLPYIECGSCDAQCVIGFTE
ncbi:hypothetical protein LSAT2_001080 [Lamellibrachia satsuma]|nr:hypothetical protein LSAT2_001080 [Lamellibrachia satsuma]